MLKKVVIIIIGILFMSALIFFLNFSTYAESPELKLGNELLMSKYHNLIEHKKIGLVTNQSGVTRQGLSIIDLLANDKSVQLTALYSPEHGLDGSAKAGEYVESYVHGKLGIPVYSLYGKTRMPTGEMLSNIDVLVFDIQDIGARSYTYMSTLNYCLVAEKVRQADGGT